MIYVAIFVGGFISGAIVMMVFSASTLNEMRLKSHEHEEQDSES